VANLNRIILVGRLAADPEARLTVEGLAMTKFRLAVTRPTAGSGDNGVDFIDIVAWRRLAEVCGEYLKKGRLVLVEGRIQNRSFEDQAGQRRWVTEVVARNMTMLDGGKGAGDGVPAASTIAEAHEAKPGAEEEDFVDDTDLEGDLPF